MDQVAFARFVRRAVDTAKTQRGWTVTRLAAETGRGTVHIVPLAQRGLPGVP